ncbi:hypothetical protein [Micromonospora sp. IBSANI012]|uniref:hypothetical protein n=1 Tax=Micromonospora sp. IBSANI012 TaxID=3457761 RepID=UPI00405821A1
MIISYRKNHDGSPPPAWKEDLNTRHRRVRAQVEYALARLKCWKLLREYTRAAHTMADAASAITHRHNIALAS